MALGTRELTHLHRRQQLALRAATVAQIRTLWPTLDWTDLDKTFPAFAGEALRVVSKNRKTSSGLAGAYLRAFRVSSGLTGDLRIVAPQMPAEQFTTSLRVTSVVAAKKAAIAGTAPDVAMSNALTQATGAMARLVLNAGRGTVLESIKADPKATGWERVLGGAGCDFCRLLAGRVYPTDNAGFDAHDHCGCTAEPVYG
jgi:hypothetical protein